MSVSGKIQKLAAKQAKAVKKKKVDYLHLCENSEKMAAIWLFTPNLAIQLFTPG